MGRTTALRRELKKRFVPFMAAKGFDFDQRNAPHFLDFHRVAGNRVQFLEVQWEKYGRPRFTVNFGSASSKGTLCQNQLIGAGDVGPGQAEKYCRLHPNGSGSSTRHWFRQDRPLISALLAWNRLYPPDQPVRQLIELYAEVETYWTSGIVGPHSRLLENGWVHDVV
jgi:hypothetical protein